MIAVRRAARRTGDGTTFDRRQRGVIAPRNLGGDVADLFTIRENGGEAAAECKLTHYFFPFHYYWRANADVFAQGV